MSTICKLDPRTVRVQRSDRKAIRRRIGEWEARALAAGNARMALWAGALQARLKNITDHTRFLSVLSRAEATIST